MVKKRNLTARKVRNIFSLLRGVNSFWHYCNVVGVLKTSISVQLWQKEMSYYYREEVSFFDHCKINIDDTNNIFFCNLDSIWQTLLQINTQANADITYSVETLGCTEGLDQTH